MLKEGLNLKTHQFLNFFRGLDLIPTHGKVYIVRELQDQKIIEKYCCALELYCHLTPAELICHLLSYARAYLRKDNSCKN